MSAAKLEAMRAALEASLDRERLGGTNDQRLAAIHRALGVAEAQRHRAEERDFDQLPQDLATGCFVGMKSCDPFVGGSPRRSAALGRMRKRARLELCDRWGIALDSDACQRVVDSELARVFREGQE